MENSSKALLIAAAVLIVILLVTVSIKIFNSPQDVQKQATDVGTSISKQIEDATKDISSSFEINRNPISGVGSGSGSQGSSSGEQQGVDKVTEENVLEPGLYNSDTGEIILSWDDFLTESGATVTADGTFLSPSDIYEINGGNDSYGDPDNFKTFSEKEYCQVNLKIIFPDTVKKTYRYGFGFMCRGTGALTQLKEIELSNNLEMIGEFFFYNCTGLTSINIPNSVTSIASTAFCNCSNLTTIYCSGTLTGAPWGAPKATVIPPK